MKKSAIDFWTFCGLLNIFAFIKAVMISVATVIIIPRIDLKNKNSALIIISGVGMFVPNIIIGFSKKYVEWTKEEQRLIFLHFIAIYF